MGVGGVGDWVDMGVRLHSGTGVTSHFVGTEVVIGVGADWSVIRAVFSVLISIGVWGSEGSSCLMRMSKNLRGLTGLVFIGADPSMNCGVVTSIGWSLTSVNGSSSFLSMVISISLGISVFASW